MEQKYSVLLFLTLFLTVETGKILAIYPTPTFSHQVVFRPLMLELANRGHEVTVITTHPIFKKGQAPKNFIEIDVQNTSKDCVKNIPRPTASICNAYEESKKYVEFCTTTFYAQVETDEVRKIINDKSIEFDLIIVESWMRVTLAFAHRFKVPVIKFGSLGGITNEYNIIGGVDHPGIYFSPLAKKVQNLTFWDQTTELYNRWSILNMLEGLEGRENEILRSYFGSDMPSLSELADRTGAIILNVHRVWEMYRPNPLNLIAIGGIHIQPEEELPKDLKLYLDSSVLGVIYVSFGAKFDASELPSKQVEAMVNVLSRLPYDVLFKYREDEFPGRARNIRISKWLPQHEILKHPNVKLFVTQGGLQSIDEAIAGGVPVLVIPLAIDQFYNAGIVVQLNIGIQMSLQTFTEQEFEDHLYQLMENDRYRKNVVHVRSLLYDTPQTPLQRAVWWTEHVLRHGALHVRAPAHNMHWSEYLEIELVATVITSIFLLTIVVFVIVIKASCSVWRMCNSVSQYRL